MESERQKYQFSIIINNASTNNSAATKAVLDCKAIFTRQGYQDYTLYFADTSNKIKYYYSVIKEIVKFLNQIKKGSLVGVQYPLLNSVFKYFIKVAKLKNVKVFCVIHDVESLRVGGKDDKLIAKEALNFNYYDCLIVHNRVMLQWLKEKGVTTKMVSLTLFDYLTNKRPAENYNWQFSYSIVFAGNLFKSTFIYKLDKINGWHFNVFGPNFKSDISRPPNVKWLGEFKPDEVVFKLVGSFGLIWDGDSIDEGDEIWGHYLKYNNPHKLSLYLAAGIPVIAPANSAIAQLIKENEIGLLINNLHDLNNINVTTDQYNVYKNNCRKLQSEIIEGHFLMNAINQAEEEVYKQLS